MIVNKEYLDGECELELCYSYFAIKGSIRGAFSNRVGELLNFNYIE